MEIIDLLVLSNKLFSERRSQFETGTKKHKLKVQVCYLKSERKKFKGAICNLKQKIDSIFTFYDIISLKNYRERNQILC